MNPTLCSSGKMSSKEFSVVGPGFQLDPFLIPRLQTMCVCVCECARTHAFAVTEKSLKILYMSHLWTKYGVAQFIQDGVVWFSELTSLSKATSVVPLETGYMAQ